MFAPNLPEAWEIEELERMRRIREDESRETAEIPPGPATHPTQDARAPSVRGVVVIQVW
jgi:hypothetical protein